MWKSCKFRQLVNEKMRRLNYTRRAIGHVPASCTSLEKWLWVQKGLHTDLSIKCGGLGNERSCLSMVTSTFLILAVIFLFSFLFLRLTINSSSLRAIEIEGGGSVSIAWNARFGVAYYYHWPKKSTNNHITRCFLCASHTNTRTFKKKKELWSLFFFFK